MPPSGFCRQCTHTVHTDKKAKVHTHRNKQFCESRGCKNIDFKYNESISKQMTLVLIQTSANLSPFSATYRTESLFCNRLVPWHCDKKEGTSKQPGVRKASPSRGPLEGEPVSADGSVFHHVVWKCLQGKVSPRGYSALQGLRGLQPQAVPAIPLGYQKTST